MQAPGWDSSLLRQIAIASNESGKVQSTMEPIQTAVESLVSAILRFIGSDKLANGELGVEYTYASLPLCVIDAVFSIGVRYEGTTRPTVLRFCASRGWEPYSELRREGYHSIAEFIGILNGLSDQALAEQVFNNRQRTSSRNGILKAKAVKLFADALLRAGINNFTDLEDEEKCAVAERIVQGIAGQKSGISFKYFRMLAGDDDHVKGDRQIISFVSNALGRQVSSQEAETLVKAASRVLRIRHQRLVPRLLDYLIWDYMRSGGGHPVVSSPCAKST